MVRGGVIRGVKLLFFHLLRSYEVYDITLFPNVIFVVSPLCTTVSPASYATGLSLGYSRITYLGTFI